MTLSARGIADRLLITAIAVAGIALAVRFIIDDRVRRDPQCLEQKPSLLYRAETLAKISMQCVSDAKLDQATQYAHAALLRQPHNQLALAALGSVADIENDPVRADLWFGRAKELGHRDYAVETYWIARSSAHQQWGKVAQHIDALFRAGWISDDAEAQLRQLEGTVEGRKAIIAIIHPSSPWIIGYLKNTAPLTETEIVGRTKLLLDIDELGIEDEGFFNLSVAVPAINTLYDRQEYEAAYELRRAFAPFTNGSIVNDPNFYNISKDVSNPFDWSSKSSAGLDLSLDQSPSGVSILRLNVNDPGRYLVLEQTMRLEPGEYVVRIKGNTPGQIDSNFSLEIQSVGKAAKHISVQLATPQGTNDNSAIFTISKGELFFRVSLLLDAADTNIGSALELRSFTMEKVR